MRPIQRRNNGLGFFFVMMVASAILGGFLVLLGLKYTNLGATLIPQGAAQNPASDGIRTDQRAPILTPEQVRPTKALEAATINVVRSVGPAVVMITTREQQTVLDFFFQPVTREYAGLGSGVIFDSKNGYILTNNHVIAGRGGDSIQITVVLSDGRTFPGEVVGADPLTDLAVVKIDGRDLPVARLGDSNRIQVGQFAVAIGNPLGENLRNTVTMGVVSAVDRTLQVSEDHVIMGMIQTDASINPGNSGGPLLNSDGEIIGINTAIVAQAQGIGFAIPINTAKSVANQLISKGRVERPGFGISYRILDENGLAKLEGATRSSIPAQSGALVVEIVNGGGAAAAGLRPYDLLVKIDGREINPQLDLSGYIAGRRVGEKLPVVFYRLEQGSLGRRTWRKMAVNVRVGIVR